MSDSFCDPMDCSPLAPLSIGLPRQEYWNGLPHPSPEGLSNLGMEAVSPALAGGFFTTKPSGKSSEPFIKYFYLVIYISVFFLHTLVFVFFFFL